MEWQCARGHVWLACVVDRAPLALDVRFLAAPPRICDRLPEVPSKRWLNLGLSLVVAAVSLVFAVAAIVALA
jgi:hypothetical protein